MFETYINKILNIYPTESEIISNKVISTRIHQKNFKNESKNKTFNIVYFYNNGNLTAKILKEDNDKETIYTYCYESNNILKLVYKNGSLMEEYLLDDVIMKYKDGKSYKFEKNRLVEIYDKTGLIDSITYEYNEKDKLIKESGSNYSIEYLYNRNNNLKRVIHTVNDKVIKDILIVYKKRHCEIEDLLTKNSYHIFRNDLKFPNMITKYDKNNQVISKTELLYILEE